jgi:hypothetical protein
VSDPSPRRGTGRRIALVSLIWIGTAAAMIALAAWLLFQGCSPGDCLVQRTMIVWIVAATVPFALLGLGIHLAAVVFVPRNRFDGDGD